MLPFHDGAFVSVSSFYGGMNGVSRERVLCKHNLCLFQQKNFLCEGSKLLMN